MAKTDFYCHLNLIQNSDIPNTITRILYLCGGKILAFISLSSLIQAEQSNGPMQRPVPKFTPALILEHTQVLVENNQNFTKLEVSGPYGPLTSSPCRGLVRCTQFLKGDYFYYCIYLKVKSIVYLHLNLPFIIETPHTTLFQL